MGQPWQTVFGVLVGLVVVWLTLVLILWRESRRHQDGLSFRAMLRLVPDVVRLLQRLAADRTVPRGVRVWLALLLIYLISPIDLIPDFIPVVGYADDALMVALAIRFATRRAGSEAIERHWPGTSDGLASVLRFAGLPDKLASR
jgi:uncharacterized membrane protein YkvA (DUF1232 family)